MYVCSASMFSVCLVLQSLGEVLTLCSCNEAERLDCKRNWSLFFFGNFVASCCACCGWHAGWDVAGWEKFNYNYKSLLSAANSVTQTRGGENIFPMVLGEHRGCPICWKSLQIWELCSRIGNGLWGEGRKQETNQAAEFVCEQSK